MRVAPSARSLRASGAVLLRSWAIARLVRTSAATAVIAPKMVSAITSGSMACRTSSWTALVRLTLNVRPASRLRVTWSDCVSRLETSAGSWRRRLLTPASPAVRHRPIQA